MKGRFMSTVNVITIDGPAGSGKSTISRLLADKIGYAYLDTGAMYRAIALAVKRRGISLNDPKALRNLCETISLRFVADCNPPRLLMEDEDISDQIRNPEIDMLSSSVSTVKEVREVMGDLQRKMSQSVETGLVAEGRDMGTVVFPDARFKFLLTASLEERAQRRYKELVERGEAMERNAVMARLKERDHQDENRALAPLRPAPDAFILDSTGMGIEEVVQRIMNRMSLFEEIS